MLQTWICIKRYQRAMRVYSSKMMSIRDSDSCLTFLGQVHYSSVLIYGRHYMLVLQIFEILLQKVLFTKLSFMELIFFC